jgi:hypothetical protein
MGLRRGAYVDDFPVGTTVRIADRETLEMFHREWRWHHPLDPTQLAFAGRPAAVKSVSFYHGGDELYELHGVPGIWHGQCLRTLNEDSAPLPDD